MVGDAEGRSLRSRDSIVEVVGRHRQVLWRRVLDTHLLFGKITLGVLRWISGGARLGPRKPKTE